jgi:hypothetical protein
VQPITMLATADGGWLLPNTPEFFEALGDPDPDYDAVAFAIKNLGFVKFQIVGHSIGEIELHPRNVELRALLATQQEILASQCHLFRIKYFDTAWHSEISSSPENVIGRLSELCTKPAPAPFADRYVVEAQDFSRVFDEESNWLRPLAVKWRMSFGQFDSSVISLAVAHRMLSRLIVVGVMPGRGEPVWRFIGDGHKWLGSNYHLRGIGEKVQNMPDKDYGGWATEWYKSVAAARQPRYDLVTGTIQYQDEAGRPRVRTYERLMLPWRTPSAEVFVTMCSRGVDAIDDSSKSLASSSERALMKSASSSRNSSIVV